MQPDFVSSSFRNSDRKCDHATARHSRTIRINMTGSLFGRATSLGDRRPLSKSPSLSPEMHFSTRDAETAMTGSRQYRLTEDRSEFKFEKLEALLITCLRAVLPAQARRDADCNFCLFQIRPLIQFDLHFSIQLFCEPNSETINVVLPKAHRAGPTSF